MTAIAGGLVAACVLVSGCGGAVSGAGSTAAVTVTERDFHISLSTDRVPAGDLILHVQNAGPDQHELIVAPDGAGSLPLRADGLTVDEASIQSSEPGSLDPAPAGTTRTLGVRLEPGRYVLFCNMSGHYMAGMRTILVVTS